MSGGKGPGNNGLSRGPGAATLNYSNATQLGELATAKKLPPGRARPEQWQTIGVTRAAPQTDAQRDATTGSAAAVGSGGEASWRRRVAPHHREVVRKFFTPAETEKK